MRIKKLNLVNVKIHNEKEFIFDGSTMILGHNGAGKSTIVESIYYALFRELLVPNVDAMISNNIKKIDKETGKVSYLKPAYIELELEANDKSYLIKSPLCKCNGYLKELQNVDGIGETYVEISNKITDMYSYINSKILCNTNAEYFMNTIYTAQMDILSLVSQNEAARQKAFDKIIGITKFQNIYDGVTKTYTIANKLQRPDIKELKIKKDNIKVNINDLEIQKNALEEEINSLKEDISNNEVAISDMQKVQESTNATYTNLSNIYQQLYEKNSNYSTLKSTLDNDKANVDNLLRKQEDIESQEVPTEEDLSMRLEDIQKIVTSLSIGIDNISRQKEVLEEQRQSIINNTNRYNRYIKDLETLNTEVKQYNEKLNACNIEIDNITKLSEGLPEKINEIENEIDVLSKQINDSNIEMFNIINNYKKNPLVNYEEIQSYFQGMGELNLTQDKYTCPYCKQTISKKKFKDQIDKDKESYYSLYKIFVNLKSDLDLKQNSLLNIKATFDSNQNILNQWVNNRDRCIQEINSKNDFIKRLESNPVEKPAIDTNELFAKEEELDRELDLLNNYMDMGVLKYNIHVLKSPMHIDRVKNIFASNQIRQMIYDYERLKESFDIYNRQLSDINSQLMFAKNNLTQKQLQVSKLENQMKDILLTNGFKSVKEVYDALIREQNDLNEVNTDIYNRTSELNISKTKLVEKERMLNLIINNLNNDYNEVNNIDKILSNEEKIINKIRMINVAKAYFKQDGLAKYVRKYYIDKINERMKEYVGLFNFDFVPVITDTAGIENYHMYSGGQKIAIAILMKMILNFILNNPINMMILDEPTPYMDTERVEAITDLVTSIKDKLQVIVITHDEEFMKVDCNRIEL
jgi:exonuclease SbcC